MKTKDFLKKHRACADGAKWALSISDDMADVWDAMIKDGKYEWLIWTLSMPGVFPGSVLLKLACRIVRETPLMDGLVVWDLLADERSRKAVEVTEAYADGKATDEELRAARVSAYAAYSAAHETAAYPASRAVYAAYAAAYLASRAVYAAYAAAAAYVADAAAYAADAAAYAARAADAVAYAAAYAGAAAYAHAKAAQIKMIAEIGNPFRKGKERKMSESKHTPGPWRTDTDIFHDRLDIRDESGRRIAVCMHDYPMSMTRHDANAHLIAAAPELLGALEDCCVIAKPGNPASCCPVYRPGEHGGCSENEDGECHIWKAIQKARGQEDE